jgi:uncharacterized pyridoxal phosphate-containing UPF0001 family protein
LHSKYIYSHTDMNMLGEKPLRETVAARLSEVLHELSSKHFAWTNVSLIILSPPLELFDKAQALPRDIKWHFIGALQTNKCKKLAEELPNLWAVESVDTIKKADALEKGRAALISASPDIMKLNIYIQVNTSGKYTSLSFVPWLTSASGEESKSGCLPREAVNLCRHILCACPHLELQGLMTIGSMARSKAVEKGQENDDFVLLRETADRVSAELKISLELNMGMSGDFEQAVLLGASSVRYAFISRNRAFWNRRLAERTLGLEQKYLARGRQNKHCSLRSSGIICPVTALCSLRSGGRVFKRLDTTICLNCPDPAYSVCNEWIKIG